MMFKLHYSMWVTMGLIFLLQGMLMRGAQDVITDEMVAKAVAKATADAESNADLKWVLGSDLIALTNIRVNRKI